MTQKTILFDLDGTLTDSGEGIMNCAAFALEHFGLPVPPRQELRVFVGPPLEQTFQKFGVPADKAVEAIGVFRKRYVPIGIYENHPYSGIHDLLETLHARGHRLFVATSKPEEMAIQVLNHFGMAQFFEQICGATMDESRVEKADVIAYLLDQIGSAENTVMVGDTAFDVIGAATHQIPTIGVAWGYGKADDMLSAGATAVAKDVQELLELLEA